MSATDLVCVDRKKEKQKKRPKKVQRRARFKFHQTQSKLVKTPLVPDLRIPVMCEPQTRWAMSQHANRPSHEERVETSALRSTRHRAHVQAG